MQQPNSFLYTLLAISSLAVPAFGTSYYTNFDGYNSAINLAGQNGWLTNDSNDTSGLQNLGNEWGSRSAYIGFATPSVSNVYVYHGTSTPLVDTVGDADATFSSLFRVIDSDSNGGLDSGQRDTFGFRLENGSGANLFSFFLTPNAQVANPEAGLPAYHTYSWSTGNNVPTVVLPGNGSLENGNSYLFTVNFFQGAGSNVDFTASVGNQSFSGVLPNANTEVIANFGAIMNSYQGNAATSGSNYMNFDNVSLVPEPSSALLGLLGASFAMGRRRRA